MHNAPFETALTIQVHAIPVFLYGLTESDYSADIPIIGDDTCDAAAEYNDDDGVTRTESFWYKGTAGY